MNEQSEILLHFSTAEMPQLTRPHFYELLFLRISNSVLQTKSAPFWELRVLLFSLTVSEVINTSDFVFAQSSKDCKTNHIHWLDSLVSFPLESRKVSKWVCLFEEGEIHVYTCISDVFYYCPHFTYGKAKFRHHLWHCLYSNLLSILLRANPLHPSLITRAPMAGYSQSYRALPNPTPSP